MPKLSHEALVHLVRAAPEVIVGLLRHELGLELPTQAQSRITAAELVDLMLSVAAHGREPGAEYIALAALAAVRDLDRDQEVFYPDFILGEVARAALEQLLNKATYEYQSDFARKYIAMGKAEGKAQLLLKLLHLKGFPLSPELAARVESCRDLAQLDRWAERVLTATALDEIFAR